MEFTFNRKQALGIALLAICGVLTAGCGNVVDQGILYAPASSTNIGTINATTGVDQWGVDNNFKCSGEYSVAPVKILSSSRANYYEVCSSVVSGQNWSILVHGQTSVATTLCVLPALMTTAGTYSWIRDPSIVTTAAPTSFCSPITSTGAYFTFASLKSANVSFNAAYIVEQPNLALMLSCLKNNNLGACPAYSQGTWSN